MKLILFTAMAFGLSASAVEYPAGDQLVKVLSIKINKNTGEVRTTTYQTRDGNQHVRVFNIESGTRK